MTGKPLWILALPLILAVTSCGPVTYTLPVEKRTESAGNIDFQGTLPGIVTLVQRGDSDSALVSSLAIGMAEQLEADLGLDPGSVPVYSMYAEDVDMSDSTVAEYVHSAVGVEFLIAVDSMSVGEFSVEVPEGKSYSGGTFLRQTVVTLPYSIRIQVFGSSNAKPVEVLRGDDFLQWTLLSEAPLTRLRAIEKVNGELDGSFRSLGSNIAGRFVPQWETVNTTLYVYNDRKWTEACRLAYLFEWDKAMEIWYGEAESPDMRKAACAAYNLSVACEILGLDESAARWKARYEELVKKQ